MSTLVQSVLATAPSPASPPLPARREAALSPKPATRLLTPVLPQTGVVFLERRRVGL